MSHSQCCVGRRRKPANFKHNVDHLYYGLNELDQYTKPSSMPFAERKILPIPKRSIFIAIKGSSTRTEDRYPSLLQQLKDLDDSANSTGLKEENILERYDSITTDDPQGGTYANDEPTSSNAISEDNCMKNSQPNEPEDVFSAHSIDKMKRRRQQRRNSQSSDASKFNFAEWDSIMDELLPGELGDDVGLEEQEAKTEDENEDETNVDLEK